MIVRDLTQKKTKYKGHPCHAVDRVCPCRPCYNCHDCTPPNRAYSKQVYSDTFHCANNWNTGCPQPKPEPKHILNRQHRCKRCGEIIKGDYPTTHHYDKVMKQIIDETLEEYDYEAKEEVAKE